MLELQLFGAGRASYGDQSLVGFPVHQCHRLFCYLLLNRDRPHPRERLAAIFWCGQDAATSRAYLRNALWKLRLALESAGAPADEYLSITDGTVCFSPTSPFWLDIDAFEAGVTRCQDLPGEQLTPGRADCLAEAADLYVGDLLEGSYEDWCLYDRERLRLLYVNTLSKLLAYCEHGSAYERGLVYGERILALDPTREKVHRQMMRLYWSLGSRGAALAQYDACTRILREELSVPPMESTTRLHQQMVRNQFSPETWRLDRGTRLLERIGDEQSAQAVAQHTLQKLHRLQTMAEETSTELRLIERLIRTVLLGAKNS